MIETQALGFVLNQSPLRQSHFTHRRRALSCASHPDAVALIAAWRANGGLILGTHFPTRRWAKWLPHTVLLQKARGDFRVRLAGFGLLCFHGFDPTGKLLSEVHKPADYLARAAELDEVLATGRLHVARRSVHYDGETVMAREVVSLPVLAADTRTRLVMAISFWTKSGWLN